MKGRPDRFFLEAASSGRSMCRRCKRPIPKGEARLSALCAVMPGRVTKMSRHVGCARPSEVVAILVAHGSLERMPCALGGEAKRAALSELACLRDAMRNEAAGRGRGESRDSGRSGDATPQKIDAAPQAD